jgi:2-polyprenyl-3-methyl-5-hydroxy-6-metoxy-1,4-benzoquinol methylase
MSRPRYAAAALLDRASAARPVARAREIVRAARAAEPRELAPDGLPYPPARLRVLVSDGSDAEWFFRRGADAATAIVDILDRAGVATSDVHDVLDFGCGCGRVTRHLTDEPWSLSGCDYNVSAVEWCQRHLPFMQATVNGLEPPTRYSDDQFDLVYALSVITHLTDDLGRAWIEEWRRMIRPGGLLLVTTIGEVGRQQLNARQRERYDSGEPVVTKEGLQGMNACVAHHPPRYVTGTLLAGLDVLAVVPGGTPPNFLQDAYVARVP